MPYHLNLWFHPPILTKGRLSASWFMSKYSFIPKARTRFEFTIPEFTSMETPNEKEHARVDNVQRWLSARREALVEVRNYDGKSVMVSRQVLLRSQNTRETDYNFALRYIMTLFDKGREINEIKEEKPNIRLQAWFEDYGQTTQSGDFDIDPRSWGDVWSFADRVTVAV